MAGESLFLKRILIPLWIPQILVCIVLVVGSAVSIWAAGKAAAAGDFNGDNVSQIISAFNIGAAIGLALALITILLDLYEMIMLAKNTLKPVGNLVIQCIKSTIWTVWFGIALAAIAQTGGQNTVGIFLALVLFATSIAQLIYASIIYHRHRRGTLRKGSYSLTPGGQMTTNPPAYISPTYAAPQVYTAYKPPHARAQEDADVEEEEDLGEYNKHFEAGGMYGESHGQARFHIV